MAARLGKSPSLNASWPSLASLQADPWAAYLTAVYRDLGTAVSVRAHIAFSFFYQDSLHDVGRAAQLDTIVFTDYVEHGMLKSEVLLPPRTAATPAEQRPEGRVPAAGAGRLAARRLGRDGAVRVQEGGGRRELRWVASRDPDT